MTATLVDSSTWIDSLRRTSPYDLRDDLDLDDDVVCPPVVQEVLQGMRVECAYRAARDALLNCPVVESPMSMRTWMSAAQIYRQVRRMGMTPRHGGRDGLIAACAMRYDLPVLHRDRDFELIAKCVPLKTLPARH